MGTVPDDSKSSGGTAQLNKAHPLQLEAVRITGFRSIRDIVFRPGPVTALIGQPATGKSNILAALRATLDPTATRPGADDIPMGDGRLTRIHLETAAGSSLELVGRPPSTSTSSVGDLPTALYLPARLRSGRVVAGTANRPSHAEEARALVCRGAHAVPGQGTPASTHHGSTEAAHGLVEGIEAWLGVGLTGLVLLVEEPELFLPPQSQRYLYRLFRELAASGNQVFYSTHSPAFLNVARLNELILTDSRGGRGTRILQPDPLATSDEFRALSEFDASRSELFLARAAVLVEGLTERLALPFIFRSLGYDPDREGISIIECGGKANIPLISRVANAVGVPVVVLHDRDAPAGRKPNRAEQGLNRLIAQAAGNENRIMLTPDFEGVAGLRAGNAKPAHAWRRFAELAPEELPGPLVQLVERVMTLSREGTQNTHRETDADMN
jgi:hypothetical protein